MMSDAATWSAVTFRSASSSATWNEPGPSDLTSAISDARSYSSDAARAATSGSATARYVAVTPPSEQPAPVIFVIIVATACTWLMQRYVLEPFGLGYLQTIVFIVVIASLVQFVEMFLKKMVPPLYAALGIFLPLITTNCAVLGVAILMIQKEFTLLQSVVYSVSTALGFALALVLFAGIRERLEFEDVPKAFRGVPIALITAGILAMAFMGFSGLV